MSTRKSTEENKTGMKSKTTSDSAESVKSPTENQSLHKGAIIGVPASSHAIDSFTQAYSRVAESYLQSSKEIINSSLVGYGPFVTELYRIMYEVCLSPRLISEIYADYLKNNMINVARLINNAVFAAIEASKIFVQYENEEINELTRIGVSIIQALYRFPNTQDRNSSYREVR